MQFTVAFSFFNPFFFGLEASREPGRRRGGLVLGEQTFRRSQRDCTPGARSSVNQSVGRRSVIVRLRVKCAAGSYDFTMTLACVRCARSTGNFTNLLSRQT